MEAYPKSCPKCQKPYDLTRIPLEFPCGHSFCEECLTIYFSTEKKFLCFSDDKTFELQIKELSIPFFYKYVLKDFENQPPPAKFYMCSTHKEEPMKFICDRHKEFLCYLDLIEHGDHMKSVKNYTEEDLMKDIKSVELKLKELEGKLDGLKTQMQAIRSKKIFRAGEIKSFFNASQELLVKPFCRFINEYKKSFPLYYFQAVKITESILLPQAPNKEYLDELALIYKFQPAKLLFRASRDGFTSMNFHNLCDCKGPTLVLLKSNNGYYFGGLNRQSWDKSINGYQKGQDNFLLSLNHQTFHELFKNEKYSSYHAEGYGPIFGGGQDLCIGNYCNQNSSSSNLGHTYKSPYDYGTDQAKNHLAGSQKFQVADYEVFFSYIHLIHSV